MALEATPRHISTENLPTYHGHPHVIRSFISPRGFMKDKISQPRLMFESNEVDGAINNSSLTDGGKILLRGLRAKGGAALFGDQRNYDIGLNYGELYKSEFDNTVMVPVLEELARTTQAEMQGSIDGVVAPEISGVRQAQVFASFLNIPCHSIQKNNTNDAAAVAAVDSYSRGKTDEMSLAKMTLESLKRENRHNIILSDDIVDAGYMAKTVGILFQLAREQHYDITIVGIVAPIEKAYTRAREMIYECFGEIPVISSLKITDMGRLSDKQAWIKVDGIDMAIPCNLEDFRAK